MSRHSHWAKIKRSKGAADAKKGQLFSKLTRQIVIAAKEKGIDPAMNLKLRLSMDVARAANMPKDNIDRAILRASGQEGEAELFEVTYEAIGPGGVALMIDTVTDNKNRTSGNIKTILSRHDGSLAGTGAVAWQFDRKGMVIARSPDQGGTTKQSREDKEKIVLDLIEAGAEDIKEEDDGLTIITSIQNLQKLTELALGSGLTIEHSGLEWIPKNTITIIDPAMRSQLDNLYEALEEDEDVTNFATNEA